MADKTKIEWTDATWNPITGCSIVSPGCKNCYAMKLAGTRMKHHASRAGLTNPSKSGPVWNGQVRFNEQWLLQPLQQWKKPRMIFVCAHSDLFAEGVKDEWLDQIFAVMALAPHHTFQVLTKRPERMRDYLTRGRWRPVLDFGQDERPSYWIAEAAGKLWSRLPSKNITVPNHVRTFGQEAHFQRSIKSESLWPLPNVWLGVSVEDQRRADERIPILLDTPAAIRWISAEPLLGPVDISRWTASANVTCKACQKQFWLHEADPCQHQETGDGWTLACPQCSACVCKPAWTEADARTMDMQPPEHWIDRKVGRFSKVHPTIEVRSMIDWVVSGGESGLNARPMHPDWARSLRDQCAAAGVPFLFKQWGAHLGGMAEDHGDGVFFNAASSSKHDRWLKKSENFDWFDGLDANANGPMWLKVKKSEAGRLLDGVEHNSFPARRAV
ncbi:phage Gp37/Gp68 family protein [Rhizobium sp.]|uniref:DUF5131 family protein n=1 Tax=Rhizobium sp. TaxID=391 RepID=UPI002AA7FD69